MYYLAREFQHAWRRLRRAPAFSTTSLVVLGIGLGATTAMFSFVNAILLKALPAFPMPDTWSPSPTRPSSLVSLASSSRTPPFCSTRGTTPSSTESASHDRPTSASRRSMARRASRQSAFWAPVSARDGCQRFGVSSGTRPSVYGQSKTIAPTRRAS